MDNTIWYKEEEAKQSMVENIISQVYTALKEKGYNPMSQIVGYILSGDPTYITSHLGARSLRRICKGLFITFLNWSDN